MHSDALSQKKKKGRKGQEWVGSPERSIFGSQREAAGTAGVIRKGLCEVGVRWRPVESHREAWRGPRPQRGTVTSESQANVNTLTALRGAPPGPAMPHPSPHSKPEDPQWPAPHSKAINTLQAKSQVHLEKCGDMYVYMGSYQ